MNIDARGLELLGQVVTDLKENLGVNVRGVIKAMTPNDAVCFEAAYTELTVRLQTKNAGAMYAWVLDLVLRGHSCSTIMRIVDNQVIPPMALRVRIPEVYNEMLYGVNP